MEKRDVKKLNRVFHIPFSYILHLKIECLKSQLPYRDLRFLHQ